MASIKNEFNTAGTATITLASLASAAGRCSTAIDNSTGKYLSADIRVKVKTGTATATSYVEVYLVRSEDGTNYDDSFGGTDAALTPVNSLLLGTLSTPSSTTTYAKVFDTAELGLSLPAKWAVCVVNKTGNTISATGGDHSVTYREKYLTVA